MTPQAKFTYTAHMTRKRTVPAVDIYPANSHAFRPAVDQHILPLKKTRVTCKLLRKELCKTDKRLSNGKILNFESLKRANIRLKGPAGKHSALLNRKEDLKNLFFRSVEPGWMRLPRI